MLSCDLLPLDCESTESFTPGLCDGAGPAGVVDIFPNELVEAALGVAGVDRILWPDVVGAAPTLPRSPAPPVFLPPLMDTVPLFCPELDLSNTLLEVENPENI